MARPSGPEVPGRGSRCPSRPLRSLPSFPRFSGVTEADLADTSISLRDVQAVLLSLFSANTILIGHSLESDLLALKVTRSSEAQWGCGDSERAGAPGSFAAQLS